jgi:hypothetical protein
VIEASAIRRLEEFSQGTFCLNKGTLVIFFAPTGRMQLTSARDRVLGEGNVPKVQYKKYAPGWHFLHLEHLYASSNETKILVISPLGSCDKYNEPERHFHISEL